MYSPLNHMQPEPVCNIQGLHAAWVSLHEKQKEYCRSQFFPMWKRMSCWSDNQKLIVLTNFSSEASNTFELKIPADIISKWNLKDGSYTLKDQLYQKSSVQLQVVNGEGKASVSIKPLESFIYELVVVK